MGKLGNIFAKMAIWCYLRKLNSNLKRGNIMKINFADSGLEIKIVMSEAAENTIGMREIKLTHNGFKTDEVYEDGELNAMLAAQKQQSDMFFDKFPTFIKQCGEASFTVIDKFVEVDQKVTKFKAEQRLDAEAINQARMDAHTEASNRRELYHQERMTLIKNGMSVEDAYTNVPGEI